MSNSARKIAIIGAGISGLSLAYFLDRAYPEVAIDIFEKEERVGGWIQTDRLDGGCLVEKGPRTFRGSYPELFELIDDVGLTSDLISAQAGSKRRYIVSNKRLCALPESLGSLLFDPLGRKLCAGVIRDLFCRSRLEHDESLESFFSRRFGSEFYRQFADPFIAGIWAGNGRELSMRSALPRFVELEKKYGSIMLGMMLDRTKRRRGLFSFTEGLEMLPKRVASRLKAAIHLKSQVASVSRGSITTAAGEAGGYDHIFITVSARAASKFLQASASARAYLSQIPQASISAVTMTYPQPLPIEGFGFLAPSFEEPELLGCIFDSNIFQRGQRGGQLTVMAGGMRAPDFIEKSEEEQIDLALKWIKCYIRIGEPPEQVVLQRAKEAIAQYPVGFNHKLASIRQELEKDGITLHGTGFDGVSIGEAVASAKHALVSFVSNKER